MQLSLVLAASRQNGTNVLRDAATSYKVDTRAIALKVKQEFAAKEKAKADKRPSAKSVMSQTKKTTTKKQTAA